MGKNTELATSRALADSGTSRRSMDSMKKLFSGFPTGKRFGEKRRRKVSRNGSRKKGLSRRLLKKDRRSIKERRRALRRGIEIPLDSDDRPIE